MGASSVAREKYAGSPPPSIISFVNPADAISLTKSLLRFDTVNPPGRERDCARFAGALLEEWGYSVEYFEHQEGRTSLVARAGGAGGKAPLCLTGHLDVVPLGARP